MLPNFLIIGSAKGGTTSLHQYLRRHPQVFMPAWKELDFFDAERNWVRGRAWYERHFAGANGALAVGEASPRYTAYPHVDGVPERIASVLPEARLLYVVRDPIERMCSHYYNRRSKGLETEPIERALRPGSYLVDISRYAFQLERFLEHFRREQLLVVVSERLREARRETLTEVFRFLGVAPDFWSPELEREHNVTEAKRLPRAWARRLPGYDAARRRAPRPVRRAVGRVVHKPITDATVRRDLPADQRRELESYLRPDVERLRAYVRGEFDGWGIA